MSCRDSGNHSSSRPTSPVRKKQRHGATETWSPCRPLAAPGVGSTFLAQHLCTSHDTPTQFVFTGKLIGNLDLTLSGALNIATWQTPNTFLTQGLSVGQAMAIIVISRLIVSFFACVIGWCGLKWHIGFTVQNRFTWGLRGSYIPLLQRCLLNFIWNALQCESYFLDPNCGL